MAATSTLLLALLKSGDEVVCSAASYGGTFHLLEDFLPKFGIARRFVSIDELREIQNASDRSHGPQHRFSNGWIRRDGDVNREHDHERAEHLRKPIHRATSITPDKFG